VRHSRRKYLAIAVTVFLLSSIAFLIGLKAGTELAIVKVPAEARKCLPLTGMALAAARPQLTASVRYPRSGGTLYQLYQFKGDSKEYLVAVSSSFPQGCQLTEFESHVNLSSKLPLPLARQLTLLKIRKAIAQVGYAPLKQQIDAAIQADRSPLSPEMLWALQEVKLLPSHLK
jgi:hypothetical protein